jgi:large subunit ribosomal protein L24
MTLSKSRQPRKQRRAQAHAPAHQARKLLSGHLDGDLIIKYNRRSLPVVLGDTVKVLRGGYRGHTEKVILVDTGARKIHVEGVTILQADGTKVPRPVDPSNVVITKLNLADSRRREKLLAGIGEADRAAAAAELEKEGKESAKELEALKKREAEERERRRAEREKEEAEAEEHDHDHDHDEEEDVEDEEAPQRAEEEKKEGA